MCDFNYVICILAVEPREYEEEAELSTTHAICLEVKQGDTTSSSGHSTTPMAQFAAKYLPGYRSEWQCGYYEFTKKKPESFTADQRILLMTVEKNVSSIHACRIHDKYFILSVHVYNQFILIMCHSQSLSRRR